MEIYCLFPWLLVVHVCLFIFLFVICLFVAWKRLVCLLMVLEGTFCNYLEWHPEHPRTAPAPELLPEPPQPVIMPAMDPNLEHSSIQSLSQCTSPPRPWASTHAQHKHSARGLVHSGVSTRLICPSPSIYWPVRPVLIPILTALPPLLDLLDWVSGSIQIPYFSSAPGPWTHWFYLGP